MADKKRSFTPSGVREKQEDYHGGCRYVRTSPDMKAKGVKSVNIDLSFFEAMRLLVALQSAVQKLNRYDRRDKSGRQIGLCLSLKVDRSAISIIETRIRDAEANG